MSFNKIILICVLLLCVIILITFTPYIVNNYRWNKGVCRDCEQHFVFDVIWFDKVYFTCGCNHKHKFSLSFFEENFTVKIKGVKF